MEQIPEQMFISLHLKKHPVIKESRLYKIKYLQMLQHFVRLYAENNFYAEAMLNAYYSKFLKTNLHLSDTAIIEPTKSELYSFFLSALQYQFIFITDCLLICAYKNMTTAQKIMAEFKPLFNSGDVALDSLFNALYNRQLAGDNIKSAAVAIDCWQKNLRFMRQPGLRILVTANMSAGKSTLINAIVGKRLNRTAQEACTGHLCQLYNKPFEDDLTHLVAPKLIYNANEQEILNSQKDCDCTLTTYYQTFEPLQKQVCIIDTPGVNSAVNKEHGNLTKKALKEEKYDKLVYIFNANQLGTNDEFDYLKYLSENVPAEKLIFVVNKLDTFNQKRDSISESIKGINDILNKFGYKKPVVCPVSAYFALLLKMKQEKCVLDDNEQDDLNLYIRKYNRQYFNLWPYYEANLKIKNINNSQNEIFIELAMKSGLYGLEQILFDNLL